MRTEPELDPETRRSLLSRLRNLDDRESWKDFFDLYWRMLYKVARRAGLAEADAQDVVQETVVAVARQMPRFHYDSSRGTFKQWLFRIVRRRIADHLRRVYRQPPRAEPAREDALEEDEDARVEEIDPSVNLEAAWEQEWETSVFQAAVARVRERANPKHFQVFDLCVRQGWATAKVAAALGMNAAQVYLARHRVSQAVKQAARVINEDRLLEGYGTRANPPPER